MRPTELEKEKLYENAIIHEKEMITETNQINMSKQTFVRPKRYYLNTVLGTFKDIKEPEQKITI